MTHVFISYAPEDAALAKEAQEIIESYGFATWVQPPELRYQSYWRDTVNLAIAQAFSVIIIITPHAEQSGHLEYEWDYAETQRKPVIPIVFTTSRVLAPRYQPLTPLDFGSRDAYPIRALIARLVADMQHAIPTPGTLRPPLEPQPAAKSSERSRRSAKGLFGEEMEPVLQSRPSRGLELEPENAAASPQQQEVHFTAFGPRQAAVETWYTLLVYAHTGEMLDTARKDAERFRAEMGGDPREARSSHPTLLARGAELTLVPTCEGVTFNPERITLRWLEDLHRAEFRFKADPALAGDAGRVLITIYVGPVIAADLRLGILFDTPENLPKRPDSTATNTATADLFRAEQIFISYSHQDTAVALACRNAYKALGYDVLIDIDALRSGQNWNAELMRMISRASIFQLFWSARSAQSKYCRQEWEFALQKAQQQGSDGEGFIRPVYWEDPLVNPPPELGHLHFAFIQLPRLEKP